MNIFYELYPQLKDKVTYISSGSPLSNNFYYGTIEGEVYGLAHSTTRFSSQYDWLLRPKQEIKCLYLTGQDILTNGVCGALGSGVMTALAIDKTVSVDLLTTFITEYL